MFSRQRLFWSRDPYDLEGTQAAFVKAAADNCAWHIRRCPEYRAIAQGLGFSPEEPAPHRGPVSDSHAPHPVFQAPRPVSPCPSGGWP